MAGGIDWFRWHHGSATDPKFRLVAKRASARTSEVLAVWFMLLERSSERGSPRIYSHDIDEADALFEYQSGCTQRIVDGLEQRGFIAAGKIANPRRYFPAATLRPPTNLWVALRADVFRRDKFTCQYCGAVGGRLEADHVTPVRDGGESDESNVVTACMPCNRAKGARTPEEWKRS